MMQHLCQERTLLKRMVIFLDSLIRRKVLMKISKRVPRRHCWKWLTLLLLLASLPVKMINLMPCCWRPKLLMSHNHLSKNQYLLRFQSKKKMLRMINLRSMLSKTRTRLVIQFKNNLILCSVLPRSLRHQFSVMVIKKKNLFYSNLQLPNRHHFLVKVIRKMI